MNEVNDGKKLTVNFKKPGRYPPEGPKREARKEYMKIYMRERRKKLKKRASAIND